MKRKTLAESATTSRKGEEIEGEDGRDIGGTSGPSIVKRVATRGRTGGLEKHNGCQGVHSTSPFLGGRFARGKQAER